MNVWINLLATSAVSNRITGHTGLRRRNNVQQSAVIKNDVNVARRLSSPIHVDGTGMSSMMLSLGDWQGWNKL